MVTPNASPLFWSESEVLSFLDRACRQGDVWRINSSRVQWRWEWRVEEGKGSWQKIEPEKGEDNWVRVQLLFLALCSRDDPEP